MRGKVTSSTCTTWTESEAMTQKPEDLALEKYVLFSFLLRNTVMSRKKRIKLRYLRKQGKAWFVVKVFKFHEVKYQQVSSFPEYIKQDKSNLVFNAVESSFDRSS